MWVVRIMIRRLSWFFVHSVISIGCREKQEGLCGSNSFCSNIDEMRASMTCRRILASKLKSAFRLAVRHLLDL